MDNIGTLCLFGIVLIVGLFMLPRLMGAGARNVRRERPYYNDPDIGSRGSFGAPEEPRYDAPEIRSRASFGFPRVPFRRRSGGLFGQSLGRSTGQDASRSSPTRRVNSPRIRSRGSFGRKRN